MSLAMRSVLPFGAEPAQEDEAKAAADASSALLTFDPPPLTLPGTRTVWPPPPTPPPRGGLASAITGLLTSGGDVVAAPLPPHLTEPSTHLAKQAEELEHAGLLTAAARCERGSVQRGALMAAWALAWHGNGGRRTAKPANPDPGETLEVVAVGAGGCDVVRGVYEAVFLSLSARRYETAWHVQGPGFTLDGCDAPKARVAGAALMIDARVRERVVFDDGETFIVRRPAARLHVAARTPYFTLAGEGSAVSDAVAFRVDTYAQPSMLAAATTPADRNRVDAPLTTPGGRPLPNAPRIVGSPLGGLDLVWGGDGRRVRVWTPAPLPKGARGGATAFVAGLCEFVPTLHANLPATDSRHRADIAALAAGEWGRAAGLRAAAVAGASETVRRFDAGAVPRPPPAWFVAAEGGPLAWEWAGRDYWGEREVGGREE